MSLVSDLNGTFSHSELERLLWPIAWSGTVPVSEQVDQESTLHARVNEAIDQLQEAYTYAKLSEDKELEIKIVNGEITEVVEA